MAIGQQAIPPVRDSAFCVLAEADSPSVSTPVAAGSGVRAGGVIMAPPSVFTAGYGLAVVGVGITAVGGMGVYVGETVGVMVGVAVGQPPPSARAGAGRIKTRQSTRRSSTDVRFTV